MQNKHNASVDVIEYLVDKQYLEVLSDNSLTIEKDKDKRSNKLALFKISTIVRDKKENLHDRLVTVFNSVQSEETSFALILKNHKEDDAELYFSVSSPYETEKEQFESALKSNLEGVGLTPFTNSSRRSREEMDEEISQIFSENYSAVSSISCIPSLRTDERSGYEGFVQGLEHLIESEKEEYTLVMLAKPVSKSSLRGIREEFETNYTLYSKGYRVSFTNSENTSHGISTNESQTMNETINNSITKSQGVSVSDGKAVTRDWGRLVGSVLGIAGGAALAYFTGGSSLALAPFLAKALPLSASAAFMGGNLVSAPSGQHNKSKNKTTNENTSDTNGVATSNGTSYGKTITDTKQVGTSDSYTIEDAHVKNVLSKIDRYFKRLDSCEAQGGFQFASYVMTNTSANLSKRIATLFKGLIKGSDSDLDAQVVSTWNDNESARMVINSIASFEHPKFTVDGSNAYFTPALLVTSKELAVGMSLPKKTIPGVTVCESASFGRNIPNQKGLRTITIGNVYHLGSKEAAPLTLDIDKFTEHVFVTGSTGTGKSFMTQSLINGLINEDVNFLVIEPAKGEYKEAYCKYAKIYGTNPEFQLFGEDKTPVEMLKVNPFSFPATTGLFGHVDKLLDVFASVWQLEYAMRPLLKQSILRAYQLKGWDTTNGYSASREFPNFRDVKSCVEPVVKKVFPNDGDTRLRNEYIGSIVGNIEEMTCGLEEQIFFGDEVESEKLFESNVVIDLSKVGDRTKSLLMNFITIKLNEYRSSKGTPTNSRLKHVTILEEAHNIFPRNATSKAVMDSNANLSRSIAELRSFGEGFIIIDQSPSAVDQSVIRNTNTKIILKLPDREDREAVGASIGLNQEQITEMAKLNTGVAVFYQSGWSESVLGISKKNDIVRSFENPNKNNGTKGPNVSNKLIENILCSDYPGGVSITDSDLGRILSHLANKDEIELMRSILNGNVLSEEQNLLRQYMILKYSKENQPTVKETK